MQEEAEAMMAQVRLRTGFIKVNAFGFQADGSAATRPCLCETCKALVVLRIRMSDADPRVQAVAGSYDAHCQLHALQASYKN